MHLDVYVFVCVNLFVHIATCVHMQSLQWLHRAIVHTHAHIATYKLTLTCTVHIYKWSYIKLNVITIQNTVKVSQKAIL